MSTIRVAKRKRYTNVDRRAVNDAEVSFRARGLLFWLLDKPDDWRVDSTAIAAQSKEGRDAIRTALGELEKAGYLVRERVQSDAGRWMTVTTVYEHPSEAPAPEKPTPGKPSSVKGAPGTGAPTPGNPTPDSQALDDEHGVPTTETEDCPKATPTPDGDGRAAEGPDSLFADPATGRVPRPNQVRADALARQTWEQLATKPLGGQRPFLEWRKRVEEALDAGHSPADVLAAAPEAGGVTRAMWDRALNLVRSRRGPGAASSRVGDLRDVAADATEEIRRARAARAGNPPPRDYVDATSRPA